MEDAGAEPCERLEPSHLGCCGWLTVHGRRYDDADAESDGTDNNGERLVFLFDKLLPEIVGRELVHNSERGAEDDDAHDRIDQGVSEVVPVDDVHGLFGLGYL